MPKEKVSKARAKAAKTGKQTPKIRIVTPNEKLPAKEVAGQAEEHLSQKYPSDSDPSCTCQPVQTPRPAFRLESSRAEDCSCEYQPPPPCSCQTHTCDCVSFVPPPCNCHPECSCVSHKHAFESKDECECDSGPCSCDCVDICSCEADKSPCTCEAVSVPCPCYSGHFPPSSFAVENGFDRQEPKLPLAGQGKPRTFFRVADSKKG